MHTKLHNDCSDTWRKFKVDRGELEEGKNKRPPLPTQEDLFKMQVDKGRAKFEEHTSTNTNQKRRTVSIFFHNFSFSVRFLR